MFLASSFVFLPVSDPSVAVSPCSCSAANLGLFFPCADPFFVVSPCSVLQRTFFIASSFLVLTLLCCFALLLSSVFSPHVSFLLTHVPLVVSLFCSAANLVYLGSAAASIGT
jgi:hypothetical protein